MKYPLGTTFTRRGKAKTICTVIDYHTTINIAGETVRERYIASYTGPLGQPMIAEFVQTTIDMGTPNEPRNS